MSAISINALLIIVGVCMLMLTINKILHPATHRMHQLLRSVWVIVLSLMLAVCLTAATAGAIDKELTLRTEFAKLQLQILQMLNAPKAAPQPKA